MSDQNIGGQAEDLGVGHIELERLLLDAENPRLPPSLQGETDQVSIAINMAEIFDALEVAKSIARFGFYPWEALVAIPAGDERYLVVEGNRRLTAVLGLKDPALRAQFDDPAAWEAVAVQAATRLPTTLPCVIVPDRKQATPALGYRHISGIKPWEPLMQARFVASLVDDAHLTFEEVAELTGQMRAWVQDTYFTYKVFQTAEDVGVDVEPAANAYSLLTVAMSTRELREHIGAERVDRSDIPVMESPDPASLEELFEWVFGSENSEPVASESREIRNLARVIGKPAGLAAVRDGLSLEEARQRVEDSQYDELDVMRRDLGRAEQILNRVHLADVLIDESIVRLVDAIVEQTQRLVNEIDVPEQ